RRRRRRPRRRRSQEDAEAQAADESQADATPGDESAEPDDVSRQPESNASALHVVAAAADPFVEALAAEAPAVERPVSQRLRWQWWGGSDEPVEGKDGGETAPADGKDLRADDDAEDAAEDPPEQSLQGEEE
ncbi:MAG: hypothetical protein AAGF23_06410, partial [Acidobacteriota bacterium]